jgi:S1-C subfamily serine protease
MMPNVIAKRFRAIAFLIGGLLIATGCRTIPPPPPAIPMTGSRFLAEGQKLLAGPGPGPFLVHLGQYGERFAENQGKLLEFYCRRQEQAAKQAFADSRFDDALFFHRNALATGFLASDAAAAFRGELIAKLESSARPATAKALRLEDDGEPSPDLFESLPLNDYFKFLVEVRILVRYYHPTAEMERISHPGAVGTGFIIDSRHVLTACHVVEGIFATNALGHDARISLGNRVVTNGRVVAWDNVTDLALVELPIDVDAPGAVHKRFGDSRRLVRGFEVFGLGNPMGYRSTLTRGVVSSLERKGWEGGSWIQFDAAQAPGSSGGILVGSDGLIYGLLVAGVEGSALNFAVPSRSILPALDRLRQKEKPGKAWLGLALERSLAFQNQVLIGGVFPVSPLKPHEVRPQALLLEVNGKPVNTIEAAQQALAGLEPGNLVAVLISNTEPRRFTNGQVDPKPESAHRYFVQAGRRPSNPFYWAGREEPPLKSLYLDFGFEVDEKPLAPIPFQVSAQKRILLTGYLLKRVEADTFLDREGLRPGDKVYILEDYFREGHRIIRLLHLPAGKTMTAIKDFSPFIHTMRRAAGDDDVL